MPAALPWQKRCPFLFARILAWCNDRVRAIASIAHRRLSPAETRDVVADAGLSGEAPDLARYSHDASPLFRRMAALQVDREELARNDPLLYRELQGLCALCHDKERCVLDHAQEYDGGGKQSWRDYCPNATTLEALATIQNCPRAAEYLRKPHSTGYLPSV